MKKKLMLVTLMLVAVFTLIACGEEEVPIDTPLTAITFAGADNVTLDFEEEFNVLDGVTATGNNGVDYTDQITYSHVATTIITDDVLDTTVTGNHIIKYEVEVEGILAQKFRTITVNDPAPIEGQMLLNPDFSQGTAGWDGSAVYIADGAEMTLSTEEFDGNPALKAEVVVGANVWTPRFGQMNVPFEQGKTYEVSFKAKSSVEKTINLQVGEILDAAPWWDDFKEGLTVHKTITTEWATYSYKFTMNEDNQRGGLLFEMGTIGGEAINATLWFDDIAITETTPDVDETAPAFTGLVASRSVLVGNPFDPMTGVTAFDIVDGDVTEDIVVVIENGLGDVVTTVDTSAEDTFTITYTVVDAAGNEAEFVVTLEVVGMQFNETNLIANPSFEAELDATTPEWAVWAQDGYWAQPAPVVVHGIDTTNGVYNVDITGGGDASWSVQLFQANYLTAEEGTTYRLSVTVSAEVARKMNVAVGYGDPWVEYARFNGVDVAETEATLEFLFTVTQPTHAVNLVFELGAQDGFADGTVTFSEVKLQEALLDELLVNTTFDNLGWTGFHNDWEGSVATFTVVDGEFKYELTKYTNGSAGYLLQLIYNEKLTLEADTAYEFTFDAYASKALDLTPFFTQGEAGGWNNIATSGPVSIDGTKASYTVTVLTGSDMSLPFELKFEFGTQFAPFESGSEWIMFDNLSFKKAEAEAPELLMNGTADQVLNWSYDNAGGGEGSMAYVDGNAVVTVTAMGEAYQPHMYQMLDGLKAGNYVLKVVVTSSVSRDLRVNMVVPAWGYASLLTDGKEDFAVVADQETVIYVEFTIENDITDEVKFEFDFGGLGVDLVSEVGTFTISEIFLYQDLN